MTECFIPSTCHVEGNFMGGRWQPCNRAPLKAIAPADGRRLCELPDSIPSNAPRSFGPAYSVSPLS